MGKRTWSIDEGREVHWLTPNFSFTLDVDQGTQVLHDWPLPNGESAETCRSATQPVPFLNATASRVESRVLAQYAFIAPVSEMSFCRFPILCCTPNVKGLFKCLFVVPMTNSLE